MLSLGYRDADRLFERWELAAEIMMAMGGGHGDALSDGIARYRSALQKVVLHVRSVQNLYAFEEIVAGTRQQSLHFAKCSLGCNLASTASDRLRISRFDARDFRAHSQSVVRMRAKMNSSV